MNYISFLIHSVNHICVTLHSIWTAVFCCFCFNKWNFILYLSSLRQHWFAQTKPLLSHLSWIDWAAWSTKVNCLFRRDETLQTMTSGSSQALIGEGKWPFSAFRISFKLIVWTQCCCLSLLLFILFCLGPHGQISFSLLKSIFTLALFMILPNSKLFASANRTPWSSYS